MSGLTEWYNRDGAWLGYFVVVIAVLATVLICIELGSVGPKDLASWLFPLFGTYIGAFLAFRLQERKEQAAQRQAKVDELNKALLALSMQYNHLVNFEQNVLVKYVAPMERLLGLPAESLGSSLDARVNAEKLVFLMHSGEVNLILELSVEQGRYDACLDVVATRCDLLVREVHPLIERKGLVGKPVDEQILMDAFGERIFGSLVTATDQVYQHVTSTVESLLAMARRLHSVAKKIFPDEKFILVGPPPEKGARPLDE